MRFRIIGLAVLLGIGLAACNRGYREDHEGAAARQAGRQAYRASQAAKRDAKEAERELRNASKDFRDGWNEAKHQDGTTRRR